MTEDRKEYLKKKVKNKKALDLGCGNKFHGEYYLHEELKKTASKIIGLEIDKKKAEKLRRRGNEVIVGDATDYDLGEKFDVIVAGELIEHLTDFDGFFKCAKKHLKGNGGLIITTPNMEGLSNLYYTLFGNRPYREGYDHTCGFKSKHLKALADRFSLEVEIEFCTRIIKNPGFKILRKMILLFKPRLASCLVGEFRLQNQE